MIGSSENAACWEENQFKNKNGGLIVINSAFPAPRAIPYLPGSIRPLCPAVPASLSIFPLPRGKLYMVARNPHQKKPLSGDRTHSLLSTPVVC